MIQRRPHCSATTAVVPEPHVISTTKSPGIGGHQHTALNDFLARFNDIFFLPSKTASCGIVPDVINTIDWEIINVPLIAKCIADKH